MLAQITKTYFNDPAITPMNKTLFTFAAYNAGQNRIVRLRKQAAAEGLDPNEWFGNVEMMVAKDIGQETVQYVSNVYKYYVAYKMAVEQRRLRGSYDGKRSTVEASSKRRFHVACPSRNIDSNAGFGCLTVVSRPLQCAGINRHEAEDERALREGVAIRSASSLARGIARYSAKRRQRIGGVGIQLRKLSIRTPTPL